MLRISRRAWLASLGVVASAELAPRVACATLVRGMSLPELVSRSRHAVLGTPLASHCFYLSIGGQRKIVTETRFRVEGTLGLEPPGEAELAVRTLGGQLDGAGELIDGQALLRPGQLCLGFFERAEDGACWVTGMAQGHYPLAQSDSGLMLRASPQLPRIRDWEQSAVKRLVGTRLSEAESLIAEAQSR
jgi:hypothetical protein